MAVERRILCGKATPWQLSQNWTEISVQLWRQTPHFWLWLTQWYCYDHAFGAARPIGTSSNFVRRCSTLESGDVGHETGTTWNLMCIWARVANKTATTMFSGLPDLAALVPTSSEDVQPSKVVMSTPKLERLGTWCAYELELQIKRLRPCFRGCPT